MTIATSLVSKQKRTLSVSLLGMTTTAREVHLSKNSNSVRLFHWNSEIEVQIEDVYSSSEDDYATNGASNSLVLVLCLRQMRLWSKALVKSTCRTYCLVDDVHEDDTIKDDANNEMY